MFKIFSSLTLFVTITSAINLKIIFPDSNGKLHINVPNIVMEYMLKG
jgi:hypothetical protein